MEINENNPDWRLEGDYFDGCNCKSICPCIFALDPAFPLYAKDYLCREKNSFESHYCHNCQFLQTNFARVS